MNENEQINSNITNIQMQGASPFDLSEGKSSPSRQLLPSNSRTNLSPRMPQQRSEELPTEMQYRLEKVFEQAKTREQHYVSVIKEQEAKRKEEAELYLKTLKEIKSEFMDYMQLKKGKKQKQWTLNLQHRKNESKKELSRLNSQEFTVKKGKELSNRASSQNTKLEPLLHCQLTFYYYTPHLQDYIREVLPESMLLVLRSTHTGKQFSQEIRIIKDEDEVSNINYLAERIPFEIATVDNRAIVTEFEIPCEQEAINFYRNRQFQVELVNKKGMFLYGYSKISLHSLLYFEEQHTQWKLQPIDFYSPLDGHKLGTMSLKVSNQLRMVDKQQHYKIQSNNPMQVTDYKSFMTFNDDESRMIHRISKFKTAHNSLLLGIGSSNQGNAQRYFQSENDRIVLMHKKKKQLESIQQYKNTHKEELMSKLFTDAINRYYLLDCQIGQPKYVVFQHYNGQKQHRKIHYRTSVKAVGGDRDNIELAAIEELIGVRLVRPDDFETLAKKNMVELGSEMHYQYNMDEEEQAIWTMSGMSHPLIVKILCHPPKQTLLSKDNLSVTYELTISLKDQYDRELESFTQKFKLSPPNIEHRLYFHGYLHTQTEFEIPFEESHETVQAKTLLSNQHDLAYNWDQKYTTLSVKLKHTQMGQKYFYILVNSLNNLYQVGCYQIVLCTYAKLSHQIRLALGQVQKIKLDFTLDQKSLTEQYQIVEKAHEKSKKSRQQARVFFGSSKPEHCFVKCQNQSELLCKLNKSYQVEARIQSYSEQLNPQRILIHAMDLDTHKILKRWLIQIHKEKAQYQQIHKLVCQHGKSLKYRFEFHNPDSVEHTFRFYSSNLSILTVPMDVLAMISNQVAKIDLQIEVKHQLSSQELLQPLKVILTITNGQKFIHHLFELTVNMK